MTQEENWKVFEEEEEALSLSDLPLTIKNEAASDDDVDDQRKTSDVGDDFEFRISISGGLHSMTAEAADMCAADEVFFQGQILPLRPSVSSDNGLSVSSASRGANRCGSRSESMEWHSAAVLSLGFGTSRSNSSSSRSSSCVSRCHSSNSHSSSGVGACDPPRLSLSNNFYSHPSPTPRVRIVRKVSVGQRSTSASAPSGWGIFRLGVVKAPEIELYDLRSRRLNSGGTSGRKSNADVDSAVKHALGDHKTGAKTNKYNNKSSTASKSYEICGDVEAKGDQRKKAPRVISGFGFSCKCSPDAVKPLSPASKAAITRKEKKETLGSLKRGESVGRSSRMFEWLEELSAAKAAAGGSS